MPKSTHLECVRRMAWAQPLAQRGKIAQPLAQRGKITVRAKERHKKTGLWNGTGVRGVVPKTHCCWYVQLSMLVEQEAGDAQRRGRSPMA